MKSHSEAVVVKPRWHLAPWDALRAVVLVYTASAAKHGDRGYERGRDYSTEFDAAHRHLSAWWLGAPADAETRLSHLCSAAARLLLLIAYELRGIGNDDRPGAPALAIEVAQPVPCCGDAGDCRHGGECLSARREAST